MFNGNNLSHELLLTRRLGTKLRNAFENNMPTDIKLSKAQISKIIQSGEFLGSLLSKLASPLMKIAVTLVKKYFSSIRNSSCCFSNRCKSSKKKNIHGTGTTILIISSKEMNDIMKIVKALENFDILSKRITKTIKNETNTKSWPLIRYSIRYSRCNFSRKSIIIRKRYCKGWLWLHN